MITETCYLLATRLDPEAAVTFVRHAREGAFEIFALELAHLQRIETLMIKYKELPMDLADASLVILSTDRRDFRTYRWKTSKPFKNLLPLD